MFEAKIENELESILLAFFVSSRLYFLSHHG